ncbi:hypothetical protein FHS83_003380 [Rhizomicrobium palustre]|uniref:Uncharacterized protein n=1 Tax=Rhizomicrobium palustre TaxID=189966 RepID=A0A846N4E2_9PROT|nr:hypothetical protein [Rhizomicrobium palustre]NIK90062.1 hypothetical protein [Rhizomicrobium palustre]
MNCPHCGTPFPSRPRARMLTSGIGLIAAGFLLLLFVHFPVAVLAAVLMTVFGATSVKAALKAGAPICRACKRPLPIVINP